MDRIQSKNEFLNELSIRKEKIYQFLLSDHHSVAFRPEHIYDSVYSYIKSSGKSLRPVVLLWACGAAGGDEERAMPAAATIEAYHTWTLIHDDIIDRDARRRGNPTVHEEFRLRALQELGYNASDSIHYGLSIAILAGDILQGWTVGLLKELYDYHGVDALLVLELIKELKLDVGCILVEGETLDIQYSKSDISRLDQNKIVDMLWRKTGVLYRFAGKAGAMLGLNKYAPDHHIVESLSSFASKCGTAFQLQDDILGIVGDEDLLGKPVGSDIREGKRTLVVYYAYGNADTQQKRRLTQILGDEDAPKEDIEEATDLLRKLGGIEYTQNLAKSYILEGLEYLKGIPSSKYRDLLESWAAYMIEREF